MKVTEHEMRGLLTGKCLPADMLVNEELPAYLVRKFADLHSDIKKQETAYAQAVDSILMALKDKELVQDRLEETEDKLQESCEKLDAVLAENARMLSDYREIPEMRRIGAPLTPATDAILNEVRAEGVEMWVHQLNGVTGWTVRNAKDFAAQLRAGSTEGGV